MSGHNKWSKIKYVKAKEDAKKGKVFARFAHEIMLAAKSGGGDPDLNPRLRAAIAQFTLHLTGTVREQIFC